MRKGFLVALFILFLMFVPFFNPLIASAHDLEPTSMSPADGEILLQPPVEVQLTFSEELSETGSSVQVFDEQDTQVDLGGGGVDLDNADHNTLIVQLPELGEGVYLVKWTVTLLDGDSTQGQYYFGVGNVTLPENNTEEESHAELEEPGSGSGSSSLLWVGLIGGLIVLAIIVVFSVTRARRNH